jgi:ABC-type Zn uptake system ZnuABC Zn-binding protein ZnuA
MDIGEIEMKERYNVLIYLGKGYDTIYDKRDREILFIHPRFGCNYGAERIEGENFYDWVKNKWFNIKNIIEDSTFEKEELCEKINDYEDKYRKNFKILSGSMEEIIGEIKKILLLMEVI